MKKSIIIVIFLFYSGLIFPQGVGSEMYTLTKIREDVKSKRVGSYDRSGGNKDRLTEIQSGETATIMNVKGAGIINHIWITIAPKADELSRNDIIIRMYWDGNPYPSVEAPIGPFFGNGWDEAYNFLSAPLCVSPTGGKSYVSYFAMPYSAGAKIEIENQSDLAIHAFYFNIDYVEMDKLPKGCGRFHAWYNREFATVVPEYGNEGNKADNPDINLTGENNYVFADIKGKGHFVGVNYYINSSTKIWYGEGDEMVFLDGEKTPSIIGTGTEDFFNTSWCPKEEFYHPYFGFPRINEGEGFLGRTHIYRFFIQDPIYFRKSCKFTIEHGHNNNLPLDLASVAYWYLDKAIVLPKSLSKEQRAPKAVSKVSDQ